MARREWARGVVRPWRLAVALLLALALAGCGSEPAYSPPVHHAGSKPKSSYRRITGSWYRVRKRDTLWSISWRAGIDYRTLARWNGLRSPYTIYPGQLLRLTPPPRHHAPKRSRPAGKGSTRPRTATRKPKPATRKSTAGRRLHWMWPLRGNVVSRFSYSDPDRDGIEIAGKRGQKVVAAENGTVVYSGSGLIGYGQLIIIKHNDEFLSAYGHNSRLLVKEGQKVKRGQQISNLGVDSSGRAVLHFEIRRHGKPVDPLHYLPRG